MVRPMSFLLGFWLATLFVVGQNAHTPPFLTWVDGLAAGFAILGGLISPFSPPWLRLAGPLALTTGLFAASFIALATRAPLWEPACTLMGAAVYIAIVVAEWAFSPRNRGTMAPADS